jgi:hypothetical protein
MQVIGNQGFIEGADRCFLEQISTPGQGYGRQNVAFLDLLEFTALEIQQPVARRVWCN